MKKIVLSIVAGVALLASTVGGALAAAPSTPGIPGTSNCKGQTTAYSAQFLKQADLSGFSGLAGFARFPTGLISVQELHVLIDAYCGKP